MNSYEVLKPHVWIYKHLGLWPPNGPSSLYKIFSFLAITVMYTAFPVTLLISLMFVESMNQVVDNLVITSSLIMASVKGVNVYRNQPRLQRLFSMLAALDSSVTSSSEQKMFEEILTESRTLLRIFMVAYLSAWSCLVSQVFWSNTDQILWSSTYFYPIEALHTKSIYYGVFIYQGFSNFCICVIDASADTYGVVLNHILGGHIEVLGKRIRELGHHRVTDGRRPSDREATATLINCVKTYQLCLDYSKLLESILSPALFLQFGVSGLVLCTCAFQLSETSPSDLAKFLFTISYFICMIIEIFVPCFFGSVVMQKSRLLTYTAFHSNWMERGPLFTKSLSIFVERTFRPIATFAGGLFLLHLPVFLSIVRTAYSLFALLKNVQKK